MRIVLDCNVIVSAARVDGTCREVIDKAVRAHEIVLSAPILSEYRTIAARPSQAQYRETMEFVIREIEQLAIVVAPADVVFGLHGPDDEVYLATAVAGGALVTTGTTPNITEVRYGPVEVWSPRDFLNRAF